VLGSLKTYLRHTSWPIIAAMLALIAIGVTAIAFSEGMVPGGRQSARTQIVYAVVALVGFVIAATVHYQRAGRAAYGLFGLTLVALIAVLFGQPIKGSTRWIDLRIIRVQPSEVAKLTYILMLAWYLRYGNRYRRLRGLIVPFVLAFVPMVLILMEPDLGTALLFLPTLYFMLFMAGAKMRHLLLVVALGLAVVLMPVPRRVDGQAFASQVERFKSCRLGPVTFYSVDESLPWRLRPRTPVAYCRVQIAAGDIYDLQPLCLRVMKPHQAGRIEGWLRQDDPRVALREGYQLRWSLITLAAGSWAGGARGPGGRDILPLALNQLPDERTDFIFSVIGGRWGFCGCLAVMMLYGVIFLFGTELATVTHDPFARLLAVGVLGLLLSQILINVAMTMGLMPITGMTLPLVSYGGSSLVVNCIALGLLVNVGLRRAVLLSPRPFEHGQKRDRRASIESAARLKRKSKAPRKTDFQSNQL